MRNGPRQAACPLLPPCPTASWTHTFLPCLTNRPAVHCQSEGPGFWARLWTLRLCLGNPACPLPAGKCPGWPVLVLRARLFINKVSALPRLQNNYYLITINYYAVPQTTPRTNQPPCRSV